MKRKIYADNAATTGLSEGALRAMMPYLTEEYGNPSSLYEFGQKSKEAIEEAREEIAAFLQDNNEKYQRYGVKLDDYIDVEKLRKAYRVDVRVLQKYWEDRDPDEWLESVVVARYKGQWRVLTIFDPDIY